MKQIEVFKKIGGIIGELSEQYEYLKTITEDLNELELELFAANAHFLADHIEVLCKLNAQRQAEPTNTDKSESADKPVKSSKTIKPASEPPMVEPKYFEPVVQQIKFSPEIGDENNLSEPAKTEESEIASISETAKNDPGENEATPAALIEPEKAEEEPETIRHELVIDESMLLDEDEEIFNEPPAEPRRRKPISIPAEKEPAGIPATILNPVEEKIVITEIKEEVLTINQKISAQAGDKAISRTEQMNIKPIADLKLAITLNDKLLYVKDLFNGYNLAYSEAIEILNRFTSFEEAARFLKTNYVTKNNWDGKPATTEKFYALLKRRYA